MTREEIIEGLKLLEDNMVHFDELQNDKGEWIDVHELLYEAIQALSQEPCDDAISRILKRMWNCRGKHTTSIDKVAMEQIIRDELSVTQKPIECDDAISREAVCEIISDIRDYISVEGYWAILERLKKLPSVTQKSGKWIRYKDNCLYNQCSYCGASHCREDNFCPNCGACMKDGRTLDEFIEDSKESEE